MLEAKYFVCVFEIEDDSEKFELSRSFRPIVKFFDSRNAAEEWVQKKGAKYNLAPDEYSGRCLAAWEGKKTTGYGWKEVKIALFEISEKGLFTMPEEWARYVEQVEIKREDKGSENYLLFFLLLIIRYDRVLYYDYILLN